VRRELGVLFVDWLMLHTPNFRAEPTDRGPFSLELRLAPQLEAPSVPLRSADMRELENEGLRSPLPRTRRCSATKRLKAKRFERAGLNYRKGASIHSGPESCGGARVGVGEGLTRETAGQPLSREIGIAGAPTPLSSFVQELGDLATDCVCINLMLKPFWRPRET
jgi:hypothetical protein